MSNEGETDSENAPEVDVPDRKRMRFEWIVRRMEALERESKTWPEWKRQDLDDRLKADEARLRAGQSLRQTRRGSRGES